VTPDPQRFGGIARLYGTSALDRFATSRVAIIGVGGVGSWAAESLARSGVGSISLVDLDELCITNTNRQIHALHDTVGRSKVDVMAERIRAINPEAEVVERQAFFTEKNADAFLSEDFDAVIDAIDTMRPKCLLIASCHQRGTPVVTCGGAGGRRDPTLIQCADLAKTGGDAMLLQVRRTLRSEYGFPKGEPRVRPFGIPAVFSTEQPVYPQCDGEVSHQRPEALPAGIRCDAGFGSATHITATFGFFAAAKVLDLLAM
jgi:tRNA A37 threonylcarbamoyladenosine dehydratase